MDSAPSLVGTGPDVTRMSHTVQDAWIAFVRGAPPWPAYEGERRTTMLLGPDPGTVERHRHEQLAPSLLLHAPPATAIGATAATTTRPPTRRRPVDRCNPASPRAP